MKENGLRTRDVVFKVKPIKNIAHLAQYTEYIDKESGILMQKASPQKLTDLANEFRKYESSKKTSKGGRPGLIAKNFIFSFPPVMEEYLGKLNNEDKKKLTERILETFYQGIKKQHPAVDLKWLKEQASVVWHNDTEHSHFHLVLPTLSKSKATSLFTGLVKIDYSKYAISQGVRRNFFKICHEALSNEPLNTADILAMAKNEQSKAKNASWRKKVSDIKKRAKTVAEGEYELQKWETEIKEQHARLEAWQEWLNTERDNLIEDMIPDIEKELNRLEKQLDNGNTIRAEKTANKVLKKAKSAKNANLNYSPTPSGM